MSNEVEDLRARLEQVERERDIGRQREAALARISQRINEHPLDVDGTLTAIAEAACKLIDTDSARVWLLENGHLVPWTGASTKDVPALVRDQFPPVPIDGPSPTARAWRERRTVAVDDLLDAANHRAMVREQIVASGQRSVMAAPLGRTEPVAGTISLQRMEVRPFNTDEIATLELFANQAAIAIETARAQRALAEQNQALATGMEREQAVAAVLQAISRSAFDLDTVLSTLAENALRLSKSRHALIRIRQGEVLVPVGYSGDDPDFRTIMPALPSTSEAMRTLQPVVTTKRHSADNDETTARLVEHFGEHTVLAVPLVSDNDAIGLITVERPGIVDYSPADIALLCTFADQAVIAIENSRLLGELHQRNRDVSAALEQQKALGDVLKVIANSATDAKPVLDAILETGSMLCRADGAVAMIVSGDRLSVGASTGMSAPLANDSRASWPIDSTSASGRAILERRTIFIDMSGEREQYTSSAFVIAEYGIRYNIVAPLLRGDTALGAFVFARMIEEPFTPQQVALIETFADQAVIAIENARLFNELNARNQEITEALRREEAGSAILRQISQSPEDLATTLQAIADAAQTLTGMTAGVLLAEGDQVIIRGLSRRAGDGIHGEIGQPSIRNRVETAQMFMQQREVSVNNWQAMSEEQRVLVQTAGVRSIATAPICRGDDFLGLITISNTSGEPISPAAVELLKSYADQAAIAIENARLIRELRESNRTISENLDTRRVMGEVLSIVASAPTDLNKTMPKIAEAAMTLSQSHSAGISWVEGNQAFIYVMSAEGVVVSDGIQMMPEGPTVGIGTEARLTGQMVEFKGSIDEYLGKWPFYSKIVSQLEATEISSIATPMFGPQGAIGAIVINRHEATDFSERSKSLLGALATQAVVAVENARLFKQLRLKTEELEVASRHKSEFLANMSHELRTPLNAIIGYAELLQEECEDLGQQDFIPDLGKIHSAGKHLLTLISGILDLSKVEAGRMTMFLEDFDVATLIRDADAIVRPLVEKNRNTFVIDCPNDIGVMHADLVKVRQVLFNLLSNSAKFTEGGTITLTVRKPVAEATVTFAIQDTGIGMTEAQLGRLFEAFSQASAETSRKYGGTGLGLALSREFCRMMGGDIAVTSEAGAGSTFTVTLPVHCIDTEIAP